MTTRDKFEKYLKKVCENERVRNYIMEFYDDFCTYFKGKLFKRDHFETMKIKGHIVEQDIVKDLIKHKDEVLPEEVLTYIFKNNIKKIITLDPSDKDGGSIDIQSQTMAIKIPRLIKDGDLEFDHTRYNRNHNFLRPEEDYYDTIEEVESKLKEYVYHEMSHLTQLKTFLNRIFCKCELSHLVIMRSSERKVLFFTNEISKKSIKTGAKNAKENNSEIDANCVVEIGHRAISEYLNQEFALKLANEFYLLNDKPYFDLSDDYERKVQNRGDCNYYDNYDIAQLIKLAIGDMDERDLRFSTSEYFKRINNLNVSEETINNAKKQFKDNNEHNISEDEIDKLNFSDMIGYGMGLYTGTNFFNRINEFKLIVENMLIEAIKNNILTELEDDSIVKDEKFLKKLNSTLMTIDSVLAYPKANTNDSFYKSVNIRPIETVPIEKLAKFYKQPHIVNFAELYSKVKNTKLFSSISSEYMEELTFFKQQLELEKIYNETIKEFKEADAQKDKTTNEIEFKQQLTVNLDVDP